MTTNQLASGITIKGAFYLIPGAESPLRRVTSYLDLAIAKHGLVPWARNQAAEEAKRLLMRWSQESPDGRVLMDAAHLQALTEAAKAEPERQRDSAADLGNRAHIAIMQALRGEPITAGKDVEWTVLNFDNWFKSRGFKLLACEQVVWCEEHEYAGTFDVLAQDPDGHVWLLDAKTGNGIYPESFLQVAAYAHAQSFIAGPLRSVDRTAVVRVEKGKEGVQVIERENWRDDFEAGFVPVLNVAKWLLANKVQRSKADAS